MNSYSAKYYLKNEMSNLLFVNSEDFCFFNFLDVVFHIVFL